VSTMYPAFDGVASFSTSFAAMGVSDSGGLLGLEDGDNDDLNSLLRVMDWSIFKGPADDGDGDGDT